MSSHLTYKTYHKMKFRPTWCSGYIIVVQWCLWGIFFTILSSPVSYAQSQISKVSHSKEPTDTERIQLSLQLGEQHRFSPKEAEAYFKAALNLAQKSQDALRATQAYVALGKLKSDYRQYKQAYAYFQKGKKQAKRESLPREQIDCLMGISRILIHRNQQHAALQSYHEALKLAEQAKDWSQMGLVLSKIGELHRLQKNFVLAFEYLEKATAIAKKYQLPTLEFEALAIKSTTYVDLKQYDLLERTTQEALMIAMHAKDSTLFARAYNGLAIAHTCLKQYEEAVFYYKKALQIKLKTKDYRSLVTIYHNIGDLYRRIAAHSKAITYFQKSLEYAEKRDDFIAAGVMLRNIGEMYHKKNAYAKAENYLQQSKAKFLKLESLFELSTSYQLLATNYAAMNDFKQAYHYHTLHKQLYDSVFNNQKSEQMTTLERRFKDEKKQKAIALLKEESKLQKETARFQKKLRNMALVGLVLMIFTLVLLYNRYQLRHKLLQQRSKLLEQENARHKAEGLRLETEQKLEQAENKQLKLDLAYKNRELATSTLLVHHKNEVLSNIQSELTLIQNELPGKWSPKLVKIQKIIKENGNLEEDWEQLKLHFDQVHPNFFRTLQETFDNLSKNDLRLCAYIRINLTNKEIGRILNVGFKSIQVAKYRLKKKLGLTKEQDLSEFIQQV